ncbi:guanylate kinase [Bacillus sp. FSL W8-0445]|uniref:guanylate kinase n=1 Tax=Bacillota TaxID=1239 RepID=UPI000779E352|nr:MULTISPECIES: guanylate kinase [Bacillota]MDE1407116.1 guanylate kinase [Bacillus licheniformis]NFT30678.1 guanylate kinase [Clostridium sporogenes]GIN25417.1 guanylate kinase [Bacillus licheniformis]GIN29844.1 guanylate kinase [Bacillus licheniformis]
MALFIITAPSGAGKTTIMNEIKNYTEMIGECISTTTRPIRKGEVDGESYYFLTKKEFTSAINDGEFAEHVVYGGHYYGITKYQIETVLKKYNHAYIIADYHGYEQLKEVYPDAVGIFLHMSKEDCLANMLLRGDAIEQSLSRIETYENEMKNRDKFDYVVKNVRGKGMRFTVQIILNIINQYS